MRLPEDEAVGLVDLERERVAGTEAAERDAVRHLGEEVLAHDRHLHRLGTAGSVRTLPRPLVARLRQDCATTVPVRRARDLAKPAPRGG